MNQSIRPVKQMEGVMVDESEVSLGDWFSFMYYYYEENGYSTDDILFSESLGFGLAPDRSAIPEKLILTFDRVMEQFETDLFGDEIGNGSNSLHYFYLPEKNKKMNEDLLFPVTGVSYEQVQEYIKWREELLLSTNYKTLNKFGLTLRARLMSPEEWDSFAAYSGPKDSMNATIYPDSMNTHGCYLMNIRYTEPCPSTLAAIELWGEGIYPPFTFFADANGLYDVYGNVAEMTSTEGIAKGGSYFHWASEGYSGKNIQYKGPEKWLGFRVLFEFSKEEVSGDF